MVLTLGEPVGQYMIEVPKDMLTDSIPGKHYHLHVETEGIIDEQRVAEALVNGLDEDGATVKYVRIDSHNIDIQLEGSPFAWAAILLWLPQILQGLGIIVTLFTVFAIVSSIPSWAWATLGVGVVLLIFGASFGKMMQTTRV